MSKNKKKREIGRGRAIRNNLYACSLLAKICPKLMVHDAISQFLGYFEWLFYSAFFMRYVINSLEAGDSFGTIMTFVGVVAVVMCSMSLYSKILTGYTYPICYAIVNKGLYTRLFRKSRNVELECFENSEFYDKYTLAMEKADERLRETVSAVFRTIFGAISSVCAFVFMYQVDKISVLFILFPVVGNFVFNRKISHLDYARNQDMAPHNRRIAYINRVMYLPEYAKEMRLTDVFSLMRRQYRDAIQGLADVTRKYTRKAMVLHWFYVMCTFTFIFEGLLIYGAYRTLVSNTMSLAELAVITSMMVSTTWILIGFTESLTSLFRNGLFIEYLRTFLEYKEQIPEDQPGIDPGTEIRTLEFRNVSFAYKDKEVLSHVNMEFRGGMTYALVGHNGAGKTTLIKLLMRLYDPTEGTITYHGRDIREYKPLDYRHRIGVVFQDYQMYGASLEENVIMTSAEEDGSENDGSVRTSRRKDAASALERAGFGERLKSLEKGLDTQVTAEFDKEGVNFSGGESQKIAISRAFYKDADILIMDEPSSALDPIAEYELNKAMESAAEGKTVFYISHRLSTTRDADRIILLENGRIVEEGTHESLLALGGQYARMWKVQAGRYEAS